LTSGPRNKRKRVTPALKNVTAITSHLCTLDYASRGSERDHPCMRLIAYGAGLRPHCATMGPLDNLREHAKELRDHAHRETDPLIKARLHQVANNLEAAAIEIERRQDRR
jgi:hypothetical protein